MASDWNGLPENPERDGWHWLRTPDGCLAPYEWRVAGECERGSWPSYWVREAPDEWAARDCLYVAPCLNPADLAARVEAERVACERAACDASDPAGIKNDYEAQIAADARELVMDAIRALGSTPAFDAAIKAAYKQGWNDREGDFLAGTARIGIDDAAIQAAREEGMEAAAKIAQADERTYQGYDGCNPALIVPRIIAAIRAAKDQPA